MDIIDAYTHCGLKKYEPIEKIRQVLEAGGVHRAVLVQHLGEFDNSYIGGIAAQEPERFAGVCLVDHASPDAVATLTELANTGNFKGVRLTSDVCTAAPDVLQAATELGLIVVLYAPDGIAGAVEPLVRFLDAEPLAQIVVTHLGKPDIADAPSFKKYHDVFRLAEYPFVFYQISGMKMYCPYPHEQLYGLIEEAVEQFGTLRLLWGSNYPVVGDEQDYQRDLAVLLEGKLPVPQEAIYDIAGGNAQQLWFQ